VVGDEQAESAAVGADDAVVAPFLDHDVFEDGVIIMGVPFQEL
jgi:hypothetical protein